MMATTNAMCKVIITIDYCLCNKGVTVGSVGRALVWLSVFPDGPGFDSWPVLVQLSLRNLRQPKVGVYSPIPEI